MPDVAWDSIEADWGHRLPELYKQVYADGLLDPQHPEHLQFTDLVWQDDLQIAAWEPDPRQVRGLLPLAMSLTGDELCWYPHIDEAHPHTVVWCPDDDEVARIYAPDFAACLYRLMLDECAGTWLVEEHDRPTAQQLLQRTAAALVPYLPQEWNERLGLWVQRPLSPIDEHTWACIDEDEVLPALEADTGFQRYDEEFAHLVEDAGST